MPLAQQGLMVTSLQTLSLYALLLMFLTGVIPFSAQAELKCASIFEVEKDFQTLPSLKDIGLPSDFVETVQRHPIMQLRSKFKDRKMVFTSHHFVKSGFRENFLGESIQVQFIKRTLQIIFPNAEFRGIRNSQKTDGFKYLNGKPVDALHLNLLDTGEIPGETNVLPMQVLKSANPGLAIFKHGHFRQQLGIPLHAKVISIYAKDNQTVEKILKEIDQSLRPDYLFISLGGRVAEKEYADSLAKILGGRYESATLSEFSQINRNSNRPTIITNDLRGKVPFIANISDVVIVSGPINIFESLSAGTKTIIMTNPEAITDYEILEFNKMLARAVATGGAFPTASIEGLKLELPKVIQTQTKIIPPYAVQTSDTPSSLLIYLDVLKEYIENEKQ